MIARWLTTPLGWIAQDEGGKNRWLVTKPTHGNLFVLSKRVRYDGTGRDWEELPESFRTLQEAQRFAVNEHTASQQRQAYA